MSLDKRTDIWWFGNRERQLKTLPNNSPSFFFNYLRIFASFYVIKVLTFYISIISKAAL